jgi:hypothetical protein
MSGTSASANALLAQRLLGPCHSTAAHQTGLLARPADSSLAGSPPVATPSALSAVQGPVPRLSHPLPFLFSRDTPHPLTTPSASPTRPPMTTQTADLSNLSLSEDWDAASAGSVPFPRDASQEPTDSPASDTTHGAAAEGKTRTISQLLRLYAEKGTDVSMSQDEANAVAEALGNWVSSL